MEKEVNEVLEEGMVDESVKVSHKPSKAMILGIVATTVSAVLLVFRKKISARVEKRMVKKLTKKGYTVCDPMPEIDTTLEDIKPIEE